MNIKREEGEREGKDGGRGIEKRETDRERQTQKK